MKCLGLPPNAAAIETPPRRAHANVWSINLGLRLVSSWCLRTSKTNRYPRNTEPPANAWVGAVWRKSLSKLFMFWLTSRCVQTRVSHQQPALTFELQIRLRVWWKTMLIRERCQQMTHKGKFWPILLGNGGAQQPSLSHFWVDKRALNVYSLAYLQSCHKGRAWSLCCVWMEHHVNALLCIHVQPSRSHYRTMALARYT